MLCFTDKSVEPMRDFDAKSNAREVVFKWVLTQAVILIDWYLTAGSLREVQDLKMKI